MKHFVGIDISKEYFHFCVLNNDGETVSSGNYPMSSEGFSKLLKLLSSLSESVVVMESSGRYHIPLYSFLVSNNIKAYVINPKVVHRFFKFISANNPSKNDKKDAKVLALFAMSNPHLLKYSPTVGLRSIARIIQKLKAELSATKTQIKYALSVLFPEVERYINIYCHSFLQVLLRYPSAKQIRNAKPKDISSVVKDFSVRGRKPSFQPQHLIELDRNSIGVDDPYFTEVLVFYIEKLFFLEPKIQKLEKMLTDEIDKQQHEQMKLISSIKGISERLACLRAFTHRQAGLFLAELNDIKNFSTHKKLIKYAGTDPVVKQSGLSAVAQAGKYKLKMSISKQGSPFCTKGEPFRAELVKPMCPVEVIHA